MSEIKLLPCPFCGKGFRINCRGVYEHENENCPLHGLEIGTKEQQEKWNTRKPMERIIERLEGQKEHSSRIYDNLKDSFYLGMQQADDNAIEIVKEEGGIE